jgi:hypothetical protein
MATFIAVRPLLSSRKRPRGTRPTGSGLNDTEVGRPQMLRRAIRTNPTWDNPRSNRCIRHPRPNCPHDSGRGRPAGGRHRGGAYLSARAALRTVRRKRADNDQSPPRPPSRCRRTRRSAAIRRQRDRVDTAKAGPAVLAQRDDRNRPRRVPPVRVPTHRSPRLVAACKWSRAESRLQLSQSSLEGKRTASGHHDKGKF